MITYELAKQLKDAGFPTNPSYVDGKLCEFVLPTLLELIEACFKLDRGLSFDCHLKEDRFYVVFNTLDEHRNYLDYWCPSLEEVFAMEWLELNKKV